MEDILDGVIILIVLGGLLIGYRHGFVWTVVKLVGCVVALVLAATLSQTVAESIFDNYMQEKLESSITGQLPASQSGSMKDDIRRALDGLPASVKYVLNNAGWIDQAMNEIDDTSGYKPADVSHTLATYVVRPVAVSLLGILAFIVLFLLFMVGISLLARLVGKLLRLPVLRQVDGILGAVLGTVEGIVVALVVVSVLQMAAASASDDAWLTRKDMDKTILVSRMAEWNPLTDYLNVIPD